MVNNIFSGVGFALLVVCASQSLASADDNNVRHNRNLVVGGTAVAPGRYPYFSFLRTSTSICAAALIHPDICVTTADCVQSTSSFIAVSVNATDAQRIQTAVPAEKFRLHPNYIP
eukprot:CAMPEP_0116548060 /NCGR_PEP_ID=MMETSP0397-20121206/4115_1 /TAXON_ID=216820 /ORGANISM="Cyclophora tenuis, Strain ECT3854" /LENGTH=114 /DNA_ID=CAMNT_0004072645 /DNA_START=1204 /DNA_END=1544 /DNA_ORIENTATION=+